jgi:hypothetical protein
LLLSEAISLHTIFYTLIFAGKPRHSNTLE